jgi:hypothetical protein
MCSLAKSIFDCDSFAVLAYASGLELSPRIQWWAVLDKTKNLLRFVRPNCVIHWTSRWTGRRRRVDLSLKHGLAVWVVDNWPAILPVDDGRSEGSALAHAIPAEEERLDMVAA